MGGTVLEHGDGVVEDAQRRLLLVLRAGHGRRPAASGAGRAAARGSSAPDS